MFERRTEPLLPRRRFARRMASSVSFGLGLVVMSLGIGMVGYHVFEKLSWLDAFLNAAMLLSGEGPLAQLKTDGGKFFAGCYAIYCGVALISATAIIFAPVIHRALHRFHVEEGRDK